MRLNCGPFSLDLTRPIVMGIVNVTPDSFSDGGRHFSASRAIEHGLQLMQEGAGILDVGGESTRPGAASVGEQEELDRVLPVIEGLRETGLPISIDTYKPAVMRAAIAAGACLVNDVNALLAPGALEVVAGTDAGVCLMHKQGDPHNMQSKPSYTDVVAEVGAFLMERLHACSAMGIPRDRLVVDPGFGFGKSLEHNLALLRRLAEFGHLGVPVLAGLSRKSMLGSITGQPVEQRMPASVAAALIAVQRGARIVRVHDVRATCDALAIWQSVENQQQRGDRE
jgi:dihydropteroate synthase